jgi:hypothetical protein
MVKAWGADDVIKNMPELSTLKACITQLGTAVQHLAAPNAMAAVQGSKQLRGVLGMPALEAHMQLVAACAAAADQACDSNCDSDSEAAGDEASQCEPWPQLVAEAWKQLHNTCEGQALADNMLSFSSLLRVALPTRFCCNEPSCCCLDRPSELQLAAGKGSKCSACGTARYCGTADQHKHWKQHKPVCKAVAAAAKVAGKGKKGPQ